MRLTGQHTKQGGLVHRVMRIDLDVADYGSEPMPRMNESEELAITDAIAAAVMSACREVEGEASKA